MKKSLMAVVFLSGFVAAGAAHADDDDCDVPMANWQPREAVQKMAEAQGWTVRRIKADDGCYEIDGRDLQGREIEVTVDPGTLAIVEMEYEEEDDDGRRRDKNAAPAATMAPSNNGLFAPGGKSGVAID
ncbi:MAG TPA: PepSY domain-containing protein [Aurantimonas sp.]|uniref:PepSY domain-containing protein n=1 Tax=Aurantimonas marianensis TaxID=2920428 RepID=A0A9X2HG01_9HYPH|nr:PepSY domain-containing protein [Aurantimonas marianensis]MCP3056324.1 PepSY domain-containing protein [Aurantimonas marianensis]